MQGVVLSNARSGSILVYLMLPVYSIHAGVVYQVYLVHLMLPVYPIHTGVVYQVYLVHLMLPVGGGHSHRKGATNPT